MITSGASEPAASPALQAGPAAGRPCICPALPLVRSCSVQPQPSSPGGPPEAAGTCLCQHLPSPGSHRTGTLLTKIRLACGHSLPGGRGAPERGTAGHFPALLTQGTLGALFPTVGYGRPPGSLPDRPTCHILQKSWLHVPSRPLPELPCKDSFLFPPQPVHVGCPLPLPAAKSPCSLSMGTFSVADLQPPPKTPFLPPQREALPQHLLPLTQNSQTPLQGQATPWKPAPQRLGEPGLAALNSSSWTLSSLSFLEQDWVPTLQSGLLSLLCKANPLPISPRHLGAAYLLLAKRPFGSGSKF